MISTDLVKILEYAFIKKTDLDSNLLIQYQIQFH